MISITSRNYPSPQQKCVCWWNHQKASILTIYKMVI